jgi:hypothetical protein
VPHPTPARDLRDRPGVRHRRSRDHRCDDHRHRDHRRRARDRRDERHRAAGTSGETTTDEPRPDHRRGPATDTTGGSTDAGSTSGGTGDITGDDTGAVEELPPVDSVEALEAWLAGGAYKQWAVESQVHASTGPHGGNVRTYVNAIALASLAAGNAEHPQDAATVKELYGNSVDTIDRLRRRAQDGADRARAARPGTGTSGSTVPSTPSGLDVGLCTGCHGGGADYILTPYPLQ